MPQRVNVILAGGILLLGLAGASLFRRPLGGGAPAGLKGGDRGVLTGQVPMGPEKPAPLRGPVVAPVPPTAIPSYYARQPDRPNAPLPDPLICHRSSTGCISPASRLLRRDRSPRRRPLRQARVPHPAPGAPTGSQTATHCRAWPRTTSAMQRDGRNSGRPIGGS